MERRAILALALPLCLSAEAAARCAAGSLEAWPPEQVPLPPNGRILLRATGTSRALFEKLALREPRLVSSRDSVPLRVVQRNDGQLSVAQVVLEPTEPLRPGTTYRLEVPGTSVSASWTTSAAADQFPPRWSGPAQVVSGWRRELGCGPESHVTVKLPLDDDRGVLLLRAEVRRQGSPAAPARFLVEVRDGLAALGHGMCGGPFRLEAGERYEVSLAALDLAGNEAPAPGPPLLVTGPGAPAAPPDGKR